MPLGLKNKDSAVILSSEGRTMAKTTEKRLKWEKETQRRFAIKVSRISEKDMVDFLEGKPSYNAYIKGLIRKDMEKNKD